LLEFVGLNACIEGWVLKDSLHPIEREKSASQHRIATTAYPCYLPILGEFSRSWSCRLAMQRYTANGN